MIEKLFAIDLPPGLYHNGTRLQARGRWYDGNGVRFWQGTKQPIGGWSARTLGGVTVTGIPNAAIAYQTNDNQPYLVVGTTTGLFVQADDNHWYDITPTTGGFNANGHDVFWQLDNFGELLIACYSGDGTNPSAGSTVFEWGGAVGTPATPITDLNTVEGTIPRETFGIVVTAERFLFLLRGDDPSVLGDNVSLTFRAARSGATTTDYVD